MNTIRHYGLELPVFSQDRPLLTSKEAYKGVAREGVSTFIRVCRASGLSGDTLKQRLDRTRSYLRRLSEMCEMPVIAFEYGLYPDLHDLPIHSRDRNMLTQLAPTGFILAAEVTNIQPYPEDEQYYSSREAGRKSLNAFRKMIGNESGSLADVGIHQTVYGIPYATHGGSTPCPHYVDIEPQVKYH